MSYLASMVSTYDTSGSWYAILIPKHSSNIPAEKRNHPSLSSIILADSTAAEEAACLCPACHHDEESLEEKQNDTRPPTRPDPPLYLLRYGPIGDFDLLRQGNAVRSLPARASRDLACPHPSGHGSPSPLPCRVHTQQTARATRYQV